MSDEEHLASDNAPPMRPDLEDNGVEVDLYLTSSSDVDEETKVPSVTMSNDHDWMSAGKQVFNAPGHVATTLASEAYAGGDAGVVTFNYAHWAAHFHELAAFTPEDRAAAYFDMAEKLYLNNSAASIVRDLKSRAWLFDLLVAHIAWLSRPEAQGGAGPGSVGPVTEARQGSISVKYDVQGHSPSATWFMQSQFGATYWQAISAWRSMRFIPARASRAKIWP